MSLFIFHPFGQKPKKPRAYFLMGLKTILARLVF